ncbi:MAG TPA: hypothetical protein VN026_05390 [Bacteroidia bacterium]|jgi:hypothetical protein|nr:hypothetical protein [Bacteroidia bacterium]
MKAKLIITAMLFYCMSDFAQVQLNNGPELDNDRDNKMNRMLGGDDNSFYCYRIRSKGKGTSFFIEKYNKKTLKPDFSKEVNLTEEGQTKIEDVEYAQGNVFIFRREYDKKADKMTLFFQTVSSSGVVSQDLKEITAISADHYEFVDFDIFPNASQTKFIIKASHKANKTDSYKTDFILMDAVSMKKLWTKTVNQKLHGNGTSAGAIASNIIFGTGINSEAEGVGFLGLFLDEKDNIYWGYNGLAKTATEKEKRYRLNLFTLNAGDQTEKQLELTFDDDYLVSDIEFSKTGANEIVLGGFIKDVIERKGRDLVKCGIFSFKINTASNSVTAKTFKFFDDNMLAALESNARRSRWFKYKLDYIIPVGDATYYVGEQYSEQYMRNSNSGYGGGFGTSNGYWLYEYQDVIIAKLNAKGEFEWIKNSPLRNVMQLNSGAPAHVFKQYIAYATSKNLYILNDDHPKNIERYAKADFEPSDLKTVRGIHGSNFVCNVVSLADGKVTNRVVLMKNEDYCFAPIQERNPQFIPPSDCEIFVPGKDNTIYIYTEDSGRDRFATIKFD